MVHDIDFSSKHNVLIRNEDGSFSRMDEPYFLPRRIGRRTWQILGDGDFSYLVEGDEEALVIDSGYGAGNIRKFCQTLTKKAVRCVANTHAHADHTANNAYFELAYMSAETEQELGICKPSLAGVNFPLDYPRKILADGDIILLKGRELKAFFIPDHAKGSLAYWDADEHILFAGDEIPMKRKRLNGSVKRFERMLERLLEHRNKIDVICAGEGVFSATVLEAYLQNVRCILAGEEGEPAPAFCPTPPQPCGEHGETVFLRRAPRAGDQMPQKREPENDRIMRRAGVEIIYDIRKIWE